MIMSRFSYCPLIWMFSSRQSKNLINKIHETAALKYCFKITYIIVYQKNLQILMTEIYEIVKVEASAIIKKPIYFSGKHS